MQKVYWAAPLFNETERRYNKECVEQLEAAGASVFLPQRDAGELGIDGDPQAIRGRDLCGIDTCDIVIATLEGEALDPGTVYEIGYATAKGKDVYILCDDKRWSHRWNAMLSAHTISYSLDELLSQWNDPRKQRYKE